MSSLNDPVTELGGRGRPDRRDEGDQSLRLLRRALRGRPAVRLRRRSRPQELAPYLAVDEDGLAAALDAFVASLDAHRAERTIDFLVALNARDRMREGQPTCRADGPRECSTPEETLTSRRQAPAATAPGCRCRCPTQTGLGLAARFVSGYLHPAKGRRRSGPGRAVWERRKLTFAISMLGLKSFIPGAGWIGLDATSGPSVRRRSHLPLAADAAPPLLPPPSAALVELRRTYAISIVRHVRGPPDRPTDPHHQALRRRTLGWR